MKNSTDSSNTSLQGIAALFDDYERKELFKKYLFFLVWVEIAIFAFCWFYQLGTGGNDHLASGDIPFPWKTYFAVAFLAPVAITFLIGVIVVGFNHYFADSQTGADVGLPDESAEIPLDKSGRLYKLFKMVTWLQKLPFLGLLLLLGIVIGLFYKLDVIVAFIENFGEKSVRIFLISAAVLVGVASVFALVLIVLNFKLRKKSMEYQYKSEVAERFGLIILEDNTVLNSEGRLLLTGKSPNSALPLLPAETSKSSGKELSSGPVPRPVDAETS